MHIFKIQATKKTETWLRKYKICKVSIGLALTYIFNDLEKCKKCKTTKLVLQVDEKSGTSSYIFGTDKLFLCSLPCTKKISRKNMVVLIFLHILHEFRHWMQSEIYGVKDSQIKYTDDDVRNNRKKYRCNKYEKDANLFERKNIRRFVKYYSASKKTISCQ